MRPLPRAPLLALVLSAYARAPTPTSAPPPVALAPAPSAPPDATAPTPPSPPLPRVTAIAVGYDDCLLLDDRTLHCGQPPKLDRGPTLANVVAVEVSVQYACAILADATVQCWGSTAHHDRGSDPVLAPPAAIAGLGDVVELHVGEMGFACARKRDATLWCWGNNEKGNLGDGTTTDRAVPVQPRGVRGVSSFAVGESHVMAVLADGSVTWWGTTRSDRFRHIVSRSTPTPVPRLRDAVQVGTRGAHACARVKDGSLWCWGENDDGELGDGTRTDRATPVRVLGQTGVTDFAVGDASGCALHGDGTVACWGDDRTGIAGCGARATVRMFDAGRMPDSGKTMKTWAVDCLEPTPIAGIAGASRVSLGSEQPPFALVGPGALRSWGRADAEAIEVAIAPALPKRPAVQEPAAVDAKSDPFHRSDIAKLGVGDDARCVVTTAGEAYCSGSGVPLAW
jgi:Regulator of chromosome condensation (RCC1) repeat